MNEITSIFHNCPPCKIKSLCNNYEGLADKVLEVRGGTCESDNIKEGDIVNYSMN